MKIKRMTQNISKNNSTSNKTQKISINNDNEKKTVLNKKHIHTNKSEQNKNTNSSDKNKSITNESLKASVFEINNENVVNIKDKDNGLTHHEDKAIAVHESSLHNLLKSSLKEQNIKLLTPLQSKFISYSLSDSSKSVIAVSNASDGKTLASILSICHHLTQLKSKIEIGTALIVAPTRDTLHQIEKIAQPIIKASGFSYLVASGEEELGKQRMNIVRSNPTIIMGTVSRIVQLIQLGSIVPSNIKFFVLEDADKLLGITFEKEINNILSKVIGKAIYILSSTLTRKLKFIQKNILGSNTASIIYASETKYANIKSIEHKFIFVPEKMKHVYLSYILNENSGRRVIVFANDNTTCIQLSIMLRSVGFITSPITSNMKENQRQRCLNKFSLGDTPVLIANQNILKGLEISGIELVIHYEIPIRFQDYSIRSCMIEEFKDPSIKKETISILSQYDLTSFQQIELELGIKMTEIKHNDDHVKTLSNVLDEAWKLSQKKAKDKSKVVQPNINDDQYLDNAVVALAKKRKRNEQKGSKNKINKSKKRSRI